jgi:hypothetical protein
MRSRRSTRHRSPRERRVGVGAEPDDVPGDLPRDLTTAAVSWSPVDHQRGLPDRLVPTRHEEGPPRRPGRPGPTDTSRSPSTPSPSNSPSPWTGSSWRTSPAAVRRPTPAAPAIGSSRAASPASTWSQRTSADNSSSVASNPPPQGGHVPAHRRNALVRPGRHPGPEPKQPRPMGSPVLPRLEPVHSPTRGFTDRMIPRHG